MRVTIIRDDSVVGVDGLFRQVDLSELPQGIRAVQWNGTVGHIEYDDAANTVLDSITEFQPFIDLWTAAEPEVPPIPTVPASITMRQGRLALLQGGLLSQADTAIASMSLEAQITWEFSSAIERNNSLVSVLASILSLSNQQVDDLFILAATL